MKKRINLFVAILIVTQTFVCSLSHAQEKFHEYLTGPEDVKQHVDFYVNYAKENLGITSDKIISLSYDDKINIT